MTRSGVKLNVVWIFVFSEHALDLSLNDPIAEKQHAGFCFSSPVFA